VRPGWHWLRDDDDADDGSSLPCVSPRPSSPAPPFPSPIPAPPPPPPYTSLPHISTTTISSPRASQYLYFYSPFLRLALNYEVSRVLVPRGRCDDDDGEAARGKVDYPCTPAPNSLPPACMVQADAARPSTLVQLAECDDLQQVLRYCMTAVASPSCCCCSPIINSSMEAYKTPSVEYL
jgi:hypothetical protein